MGAARAAAAAALEEFGSLLQGGAARPPTALVYAATQCVHRRRDLGRYLAEIVVDGLIRREMASHNAAQAKELCAVPWRA